MTELAIRFTNEDEEPSNVHQLREPEPEPVVPGDGTEIYLNTSASQVVISTPLPSFERAAVTSTEIKISGACAIETHGDLTVALDDIVRAVGVYRVTKVNHYVNKHGDVIRQQVLTPVEDLVVVPFDPGNPQDDGIVRARP